ncbi:MAG: PAS domain S-box protein [Proteobacteria bacterium]|nr:PAS domain S-box protein [Pseudomonadota bacterium]
MPTKDLGSDISVRRLGSESRSDVCNLLFVSVPRNIAFHISKNLSKLHHIEFVVDGNHLAAKVEERPEAVDAVLLGTELSDPVGWAQRIHTMDKRLPIIILGTAAKCGQLRQDLMFSPFLGHEIVVWPTTDIDGLADVLADAAQRRQQRQRYQEAAMANAHVQIEVLPLLQPETAEYVQGLFDHEPIGVVATDPNGTTLTINRQARQILGLPEDGLIDTQLQKLFPKDERPRIDKLLALANHTNVRLPPELFEFPISKSRSFFVEVIASAFSHPGGRRGAMFVLQEVTLRVQAERQRTEAVVELRLIATALAALHNISAGRDDSLSEKVRDFLRLGCEQFGLPIGILSRIEGNKFTVLEAVSDNPNFFPGRVLKLNRTYCATAIDAAEPIAFEHAGATPWRDHSSYKDSRLEAYIGVRIVVGGDLFGTLCFMGNSPRRVTFSPAEREIVKLMARWIAGEFQRERAEAHMRKLSSAIEQAADSVVITDRSGIIEYVNPSFEALTGFKREEVTGDSAPFLQCDECLQSDLWEAIHEGADYRFLLSSQTKSGELYHQQMTVSPLRDDKGRTTHLIATGQDVTALIEAKEQDRKRQAELAHVARLSTLGGMVSGLAHELNQPLCAIMTYAQTCLRKMREGEARIEDLQHGLDQIVRQAQRADEIFVRIRNFSRKSQIRRQRTNIREIVETTLGFAQTEISHNNIKLELKFPKKQQLVYADGIQIQQVLLNLVRNSLDALAAVEREPRKLSIKVALESPKFTKLILSDNGCGCPPQELHRLFEPFFTTKEAGLGVGLSISEGIIEGHGGKLWLESSSPNGSTFCLTIPNWRSSRHADRES